MAEGVKEDVKAPADSSTDVKTDERGVPLENVAKEYKRKYEESQRELEALRANAAQEPERQAPSEAETAEDKKKRLQDFVSDPDAYIMRQVQARELAKELPVAESWLRSQKDFAKEDEVRIAQIIREHGLSQPSPMMRARAAYSILQAEKLQHEFVDKERETKIINSMPEGTGRSTPKEGKLKRSDLIAALAEAEKKRDRTRSTDLISMLEDVRE